MTHEECLNILLSDSCSNPSQKEGWNEYSIELHCSSFTVIAKPNGKRHTGIDGNSVYEYDIASVQKEC